MILRIEQGPVPRLPPHLQDPLGVSKPQDLRDEEIQLLLRHVLGERQDPVLLGVRPGQVGLFEG